MQQIRHYFSFYTGFLPAGWSLTAICLFIFHSLYPTYGWNSFVYLWWFKVLTLGLTWYMLDQYRSRIYYYYFNLGMSKTRLWSVTLGTDIGIYVLLFLLTAPRS